MRLFKPQKLIPLAILILLLFSHLTLHVDATSLSGGAFAIGDNVYSDFSQNQGGSGWYWDAANFTLTLDGYNGGPIVFVPSAQLSNTFNIVVKNNNIVNLDINQKPFPVTGVSSWIYSALFVQNCNVYISGDGTLNTKAYNSDCIYVEKNIFIENITLNCVGNRNAFGCHDIVIKNSVLNIDNPSGFGSATVLYENTTVSYRTSISNSGGSEYFGSGGKHTFNNCTVDILVGARALDSNPIRTTIFNGLATYVFDNSVFRAKQGQHNHPDNSITLFSLGYYEEGGNGLTIKNNSRFEFDNCVDFGFSAFAINVLDSSIKGTCSNNLFTSSLLNITNSNLDISCTGNSQYSKTLIEGQDINISNSKIKARTNGDIWRTSKMFLPEYEKNLSLIDTQLDIEGKVENFIDSISLNYSTPEKWIVMLDGAKSDVLVNSPQLNLRHEKIVIKVDENYNPSKSNNTISDNGNNSNSNTANNTNTPTTDVPDLSEGDSSNTLEEQLNQAVTEPTETTGNKDSKTTIKTDKVQKKETNKISPIILVVIISVLAIGVAGAVIYIYKKRKNTENTPSADEIESIEKTEEMNDSKN